MEGKQSKEARNEPCLLVRKIPTVQSASFFQKHILVMSTPRAMTRCSLDLFDRVQVLEPIECSIARKSLSYEFLDLVVFGIPVRIGQKHDDRLAVNLLVFER